MRECIGTSRFFCAQVKGRGLSGSPRPPGRQPQKKGIPADCRPGGRGQKAASREKGRRSGERLPGIR